MDKKEIEAAKSTMKEVLKEVSKEERAELVRQYREDLIFGKRRFF
jgi:hypothetical protein